MQESEISLLDPARLSRIDDLSLLARLVVRGSRSGMHRSIRQGRGNEFFQYRSYEPGEDLKNVDWRVFAKRDELVAKTYQEDTNVNLLLVLDGSASMAFSGTDSPCSKFRYAQMLAACFGYLAQRQGDRVGLFGGSEDSVEWIRPQGGRAALNRLLVQMGSMKPAGRDIGRASWERFNAVIPHESIVVVLSDFLDGEEEWANRLRFAKSRRYECLCLQTLDREELVLPDSDALRFVEMEGDGELSASPELIRFDYSAKMNNYQESLQKTIIQAGAEFEFLQTDLDLGHALRSFLGMRVHS
ncbi:DUF58 domain-containing protein [Opitutales bacterium]|nr:DUF58 domain-containing protein [Opitutales bacterium]MDG1174013.1 DUF58 domain-containing protein [Opitutales bacterium]